MVPMMNPPFNSTDTSVKDSKHTVNNTLIGKRAFECPSGNTEVVAGTSWCNLNDFTLNAVAIDDGNCATKTFKQFSVVLAYLLASPLLVRV